MRKPELKTHVLLLLSLLWVGFVTLNADSHESMIELSPEERAFLEAHPVLRVHNERDWRPFNYIEDGEAKGYSIALISLLAERLGLELEYVQGPDWSEFLILLEQREIDVICNMAWTEEREGYTVFSDPILEMTPVLVSRKGNPVRALEELKGRPIAIVKGYWYLMFLKEKYPEMRMLLVDTSAEAIRAVADGKADAAVNYDLTAEYYFRSYGYGQLVISGKLGELASGWDTLHLGFRDDWPLMASAFNKAIASLSFRTEMELWEGWVENGRKRELFSEEEKAYLEEKGVIRYAIDPDWLPIEGLDGKGKHVGLSADILNLIRERTGLRFELVPTGSWYETYALLLEGGCDLITLAMKTPERDRVMDFTQPLLEQANVIVTRQDIPYVPDMGILNGKSLAVIRGYAFTETLERDHPEVDILEVGNIAEGLHAVRKGRAFGYLDALTPVAYQLQKRGMQELKISGRFTELSWSQSMAVAEGNLLLLSIINKALGTLSESEKHREYEAWYNVSVDTGADYSLIWRIAGAFCIILMIILLWNRSIALSRREAREALSELSRAQAQLEEMASTDKMTGLCNRARLDDILELEIERARRYGSDLSLIICDLDKFKDVNDTFGHAEGDRLIRHFASILKNGSRSSDAVGRWGGEEFLLICPMTDGPSALAHAESLRHSFYKSPLDGLGLRSGSFGVSSYRGSDTAKELLIRADKALYKAKEGGRNRSELAV